MKFSYNWLSEYIQKILPVKQVVSDLTMRAFEVEGVEQFGNNWILDINITPNRSSDCLSHLGMAQEISAVLGSKFKAPVVKVKESGNLKIKDFLSVEIKDKKLCQRYSARVVVDIEVGESPVWLKEKLLACGLRPINNIVDITNYVMLEYGQPLHVFDLDKLESKGKVKKIIVRRASEGEIIATLDEGKGEMVLNKNVLVIADEQKLIAIAGIKGGRLPEIDSKTTRIVFEAASFEPINIRKTSKSLGLRTDASIRFENAPDMNLTILALDKAAVLANELANGKIVFGILDSASIKAKPRSVGVKHRYIESLLGMEFKPQEISAILKRLGLEMMRIKRGREIFYEIKVPTRRSDLLNSEDLIEEIGRLAGYEKIIPKMPSSVLIPAVKNDELIYADNIRDIMAGLGFCEVYNYSFIGESDKISLNLENLAEISNPLSQDQKYLRSNLAVGLIKNLQENLKYFLPGSGFNLRNNEIKIFEKGRVFRQEGEKITERKKIGGIIYRPSAERNELFFEIKGAIEILCGKFGITDVWGDDFLSKELSVNWQNILYKQKTAQVKIGDALLGWVGELHPEISEKLGLKNKAVIFELDFEKIVEQAMFEKKYQPPSRYPAVTRDLSLLAGSEIKIEEVLNIIKNTAGQFLKNVDLFDIYEGEDLEAETKSLAFHLIFQSAERNLSDTEVGEIIGKIIKAVEEEGWEARK